MTVQRTVLSICLVLLVCACSMAQTVTGSLVGIVVDPTGSVIPNVKIQLTNQGTSAASVATADSSGIFRFLNLNPATYSVSVQAAGFKTRIVKDILVGLSENRDLGRLALDIGNVTEEVTVTAEATPLQTSTAERSTVIDVNQLNNETVVGREIMSFMRMLPGVVDTTVARSATGGGVLGGLTFNGSTGITGFMVDGVSDIDTRSEEHTSE